MSSPTGKLYIVPTPVGNLGDMTPRAIEVLKAVDLVLAEDTRTSGILMKHFGIATRMASHHKFNEHETSTELVGRLAAGATLAPPFHAFFSSRLSSALRFADTRAPSPDNPCGTREKISFGAAVHP